MAQNSRGQATDKRNPTSKQPPSGSSQPKTKEQLQAESIAAAQNEEWHGMEDFKPYEVAWISKFNRSAGKYQASPYPLVGGRLRLLREDHGDGEKYYLGPPVDGSCGAGGIFECQVLIPKSGGGTVEVTGYRVTRIAETKRGTFWGTKEGSKDGLEKLETMAVGRALRFAGYGFGFTSAEEMSEVVSQEEAQQQQEERRRAAQPTLGSVKGEYFELIKVMAPFEDDDERHKWQQIATGKISTTMWNIADFEKGIMLLKWRGTVGPDSDLLLEYLGKIKGFKGMAKDFLSVMGVEKVTDIADVSQWRIAMAAAKLAYDHKNRAALAMGGVLLRASKYEGIVEAFMKKAAVDRLSKLTANDVNTWEAGFREVASAWAKENDLDLDVDALIEGTEGMMF